MSVITLNEFFHVVVGSGATAILMYDGGLSALPAVATSCGAFVLLEVWSRIIDGLVEWRREG